MLTRASARCPSGELTLHDIQFQLCEFDKYERAKRQEGFVRRYVAWQISNPKKGCKEPFETFKFQKFLLALIQVPSEEELMQARLSSVDRTNRTKKGLTTNKPLHTGEI